MIIKVKTLVFCEKVMSTELSRTCNDKILKREVEFYASIYKKICYAEEVPVY